MRVGRRNYEKAGELEHPALLSSLRVTSSWGATAYDHSLDRCPKTFFSFDVHSNGGNNGLSMSPSHSMAYIITSQGIILRTWLALEMQLVHPPGLRVG